jgi:hypothetical protein
MNWHVLDRFVRKHLDIILAWIGIIVVTVVLLVILYTGGLSTVFLLFPLVALLSASLGYLAFGRSLSVQALTLNDFRSYRHIYLLSSAIFFLLFSLTLGLVLARSNTEVRPTSYFVLTAITLSLLGVEIANLPSRDHNRFTYFTLAKHIILMTSLYWVPSLLHPGLLRDDSWTHSALATKVVETGHIVEGHLYSKLPVMHLIVASQMIISNMEYKGAIMLCVTLIYVVVTSLSMFLLGRYLFKDERIGLLSAFLFLSSGRSLLHGSTGTPTAFATTFLLAVLYLVFRPPSSATTIQMTLARSFLALWLVLVHSLTPAALLFLLITILLASSILKKWLRVSTKSSITAFFCLLLAIALFSYWMYASGHWTRFVLVIRWGFTKFGVKGSFTSPWAAEQVGKVTVSESVFSVLGLTLLCALSIVGTLHMFSHFNRYATGAAISVVAYLFMVFFALEMIGHLATAGDRWVYYALPFLSFGAAVGLLAIPRQKSRPILGMVIYTCLLVVIAFYSITDPLANDDNPLYAQAISPRRYFRASELQAMTTVCQLWQGRVRGDNDTYAYFSSNDLCSPVEYVRSRYDLHDGDFSEYEETLLLVREHFQREPIYAQGIFELNYDLAQALEVQRFSRVYDSGGMVVFRSP